MIRCCLCRQAVYTMPAETMEPTTLPGTGFRCVNHAACRQRVQDIVAANMGLGEICQ